MAYFEVFGVDSSKGEWEKRTLIGTSRDGLVFDVAGYDRFLLYIPPGSHVRLDAIALDGKWVNSQPGPEFAHFIKQMKPTGESGGSSSEWRLGDQYTEGSPDGITLENIPGKDSYYGFSTLGASKMTVHTVDY